MQLNAVSVTASRSVSETGSAFFASADRIAFVWPALRLIQAAESLARVDNSAAFATRSTDELRIDVARAIDSLPERYRVVIVMRDFEELTIGEMAARLQLTRAATKSRLHRARSILAQDLTDLAEEKRLLDG